MVQRTFCDLNVTEHANYNDNLENVKQLISLGYTFVALNRHYGTPQKEREKSKKNPHEKSSLDEAKQYVDGAKKLHERLNNEIQSMRTSNRATQHTNNTNTISTVKDCDLVIPDNFRLLSRVTLDIENQEQLSYLRTSSNKLIISSFDLVAVNPKCEKSFRSIMEGKFDFDIVSLSPSAEKIPFKLDRHQLGLGTGNGLVFEISYGLAIRSQSLRKYVFANAQNVTSRTKRGAGVVVTSGGETRIDLRAPPDVANLATTLFGLKGSAGLDAISVTSRKCIVRALLRRETFKGAVRVEKLDEGQEGGEPPLKKMRV